MKKIFSLALIGLISTSITNCAFIFGPSCEAKIDLPSYSYSATVCADYGAALLNATQLANVKKTCTDGGNTYTWSDTTPCTKPSGSSSCVVSKPDEPTSKTTMAGNLEITWGHKGDIPGYDLDAQMKAECEKKNGVLRKN